jgi:hypothetical protein
MTTTTLDPNTLSSTATSIHSRVLLVWLTISTWSARKYDRKVSEKVNSEYGASSDAGRYNKFLLPGDCESYKKLIATASAIRTHHYDRTLAWSDEGWRLLPTAAYMEYTAWFREQQREFQSALASFAADYPAMQANARRLLNGMYRDEDYPPSESVRDRFSLSLEYSPLPATGDVRVDLGADQIADIERNMSSRLDRAVSTAVQDAWSRLHDVVSKISDRLSDPKAIFRDTLIGNARDVCETLKMLNITGDPQLEATRQRTLAQLTAYEPDILRDTPHIRARVARSADDILKAMAPFYGGK